MRSEEELKAERSEEERQREPVGFQSSHRWRRGRRLRRGNPRIWLRGHCRNFVWLLWVEKWDSSVTFRECDCFSILIVYSFSHPMRLWRVFVRLFRSKLVRTKYNYIEGRLVLVMIMLYSFKGLWNYWRKCEIYKYYF